MKVSDFDYELPPELIAQAPIEPRDHARLMVVRRAEALIEHREFRELPELLREGDLLVANDSRVMAARIRGRKEATGGRVEALLLREERDALHWSCLLKGRVKSGSRLRFDAKSGDDDLFAEVVRLEADGRRVLRFDQSPLAFLSRHGEAPLPPYIRERLDDPERYQTVYAEREGSAAAPTAGLHFTERSLADLRGAGVGWATVTLHVGLDTFRPLEVENTEDHAMHKEWISLSDETAQAIRTCRSKGGRVIAVGTTSARVLESVARWSIGERRATNSPLAVELRAAEGWTALFLTPGEPFHAVDGLLTNFHLPRSTLLMMISAFAGTDLVRRAYREAIEARYRFYSFGDAMLIL